MADTKVKVSTEDIEKFLNGSDPQKYIVAIEANYHTNKVDLVINDKEKGKYIETQTYKPFLWFNDEVTDRIYEGKRFKIKEACVKYGIKITKLKTSDSTGFTPTRLEEGYKYLASCSKSYNDLINFFKHGGVDIFDADDRKMFTIFSPAEQFMIQTGKRLFKGFEDYTELHRLQFDLETEGLYASRDAIFQIGIRDNQENQVILETIGNTEQEKRDSERRNIEKFFKSIDILKPDIITGYNSENFDWPFLYERCERLSIPIEQLAITLDESHKIKRKKSPIKFGGQSDDFMQTVMYGYNIIDISHAVRRAMAINSEIKSWSLKYITKYSELAKPNRVYVPGDKINTTWSDTVNKYAFDNKNGDWYKITEENPLKDGYEVVTGAFIIQRYLMDDLWETEEIDKIFNQASFLIGKILPTTFQRSSTMGTAGQWKLIMAAWSYENGLAIPKTEHQRVFTGGLSRLLQVGFSRRFVKFDFAALYPKTEITHGIFPDLDISGVMEGMLTYIVDTRDKFKNLAGDEKKIVKQLQKEIKENKDTYTPEKLRELEVKLLDHKKKQNEYDKKQLPLKILANSWFGSYGASYMFNWGDSNCAEETTCRGRQYLRHMVKFFKNKYKFNPLVLDTDGCNFEFPEDIDSITYVAKGNHWKTDGQKDVLLTGVEAALADFNENELPLGSRMGLDIDDIGNASINFARKNYANDIDGKIKLVGNSVKSTKMSVYIEEFLQNGIRLLLDDKGYDFINYYYDYVDKIYSYNIPLVKIASKSKITRSIAEYRKKCNETNKAGKPNPKQAHMELALRENLELNKGDILYYVNTGDSKTAADLKTETNKETGLKTVTLNCKLIDTSVIERDSELLKELAVLKTNLNNPDFQGSKEKTEERINEIENALSTDKYNVGKYLTAFNKKVKPLLVCFDPAIRSEILLDIVSTKDKKTKIKTEKLKQRTIFTKDQCKLMSGNPYNETDQDTYDDLMKMEDKEIKFWDSVNKIPNYMSPEEFDALRKDYHIRKEKELQDAIQAEKNKLEDIFKHLEVKDFRSINNDGKVPADIFIMADVDGDKESPDFGFIISRQFGVPLCPWKNIFKYERDAMERDKYYTENLNEVKGLDKFEKYEKWLTFKSKQLIMTGDTAESTEEVLELSQDKIIDISKKIKENNKFTPVSKTKKVKVDQEDSDDEDETDEGNEEIFVSTDDGVDETIPDKPDDYIPPVKETPIVKKIDDVKISEKDEWNF